jgi:hypothetical protein
LVFESTVTDDGCLRCVGQGWTFDWWPRAVVSGGGTVQFPDVDIAVDNGAQATRSPGQVDYRGRELQYREVAAVDPIAAVRDSGFTHFLHLDIQGSEEAALRAGQFAEFVDRLAVVQLGTHTRIAEGLAFDVLASAGLVLLCEEPCLYQVIAGRPVLVRDGEQLWLAPDVVAFLERSEFLPGTNIDQGVS